MCLSVSAVTESSPVQSPHTCLADRSMQSAIGLAVYTSFSLASRSLILMALRRPGIIDYCFSRRTKEAHHPRTQGCQQGQGQRYFQRPLSHPLPLLQSRPLDHTETSRTVILVAVLASPLHASGELAEGEALQILSCLRWPLMSIQGCEW